MAEGPVRSDATSSSRCRSWLTVEGEAASVTGITVARRPATAALGAVISLGDATAMPHTHAITLRDGASVTLRQVLAEDKPLLVGLLGRLSEQSSYWRFFTRMRGLPPDMLVLYTDLDHSDREAIIAIEPASGRALGVARYVRLTETPQAAELAVAVADDWHRRGVATALLLQLRARARQEGVRSFYAQVQVDNREALTLLQRLGRTERTLAGPVVELMIDLSPRSPSSDDPWCR